MPPSFAVSFLSFLLAITNFSRGASRGRTEVVFLINPVALPI